MKKNLLLFIILILLFLFPTEVDAKTNKEKLISMGEFKITYYCSCSKCSGPWGNKTATGTHCEEGRTVAVDPNVIAYGTKILIGNHVYVAEDCGGGVVGDHIDIYIDDHDLTEELGVKYKDIWLIR